MAPCLAHSRIRAPCITYDAFNFLATGLIYIPPGCIVTLAELCARFRVLTLQGFLSLPQSGWIVVIAELRLEPSWIAAAGTSSGQ